MERSEASPSSSWVPRAFLAVVKCHIVAPESRFGKRMVETARATDAWSVAERPQRIIVLSSHLLISPSAFPTFCDCQTPMLGGSINTGTIHSRNSVELELQGSIPPTYPDFLPAAGDVQSTRLSRWEAACLRRGSHDVS